LTVADVKKAVRQRDGNRCTECGLANDAHLARYSKSLEVHRLQPGSRYTLEGCVLLCIPCHGPKPRSKKGAYINGPDYPPRVVCHMPADLVALIRQEAKDNDRTLTAEILRSVKAYYQAAGLWPRSGK
jgi:hypothetical protein